MNREESGEIAEERSEVEEKKKKLNENYEDEGEETDNVDQREEELTDLNGKKNEENGEGMEKLNHQGYCQPEEGIKEEDSDNQNQVSVYYFNLLFLSYCPSFISAIGFSASL